MLLENDEIRKEVCPHLSVLQLKQLLSMYQPDDSFEDPIPATVLKSLLQSPDYRIEDTLCFDSLALKPITVKDLHHFSTTDLDKISFPRGLQAELEKDLAAKRKDLARPSGPKLLVPESPTANRDDSNRPRSRSRFWN